MTMIWNRIDVLKRGRRLGWIFLFLAGVSHILIALSFNGMFDSCRNLDGGFPESVLIQYMDLTLHLALCYSIAYTLGVVLLVACWCRLDALRKCSGRSVSVISRA